MAEQPDPVRDAPELLLLRKLTDDQRLELQDRWFEWNQAWANLTGIPDGRRRLELEAACDYAQARYAQIVRKYMGA